MSNKTKVVLFIGLKSFQHLNEASVAHGWNSPRLARHRMRVRPRCSRHDCLLWLLLLLVRGSSQQPCGTGHVLHVLQVSDGETFENICIACTPCFFFSAYVHCLTPASTYDSYTAPVPSYSCSSIAPLSPCSLVLFNRF